jgi:hypothetical protein
MRNYTTSFRLLTSRHYFSCPAAAAVLSEFPSDSYRSSDQFFQVLPCLSFPEVCIASLCSASDGNTFRTEYSQILDATVKNLVDRATWQPVFVQASYYPPSFLLGHNIWNITFLKTSTPPQFAITATYTETLVRALTYHD